MKRILALLMLAAMILGRLTTAAAFELLDPQTWGVMNPHTWPFTLIPIPEIATDPNGGVTAGALFATLFKDDQNQITNIFAPDVNYNTNVGPGGAVRFLAYPSENTQWYATAEAHENIQRQVDLSFATGRTHDQWWSFDGRLFFERDPTERFFGIGNGSRLGGESNYTTQQLYIRAAFGWNVSKNFQVALVERPRYVRIQTGAFNSINQTVDYYPKVKGINGGSEIYNELRATYDTRDSIDIPHHGGLALLYGGITDRRFMSSASYNKIGADVRHYWTPLSRVTIAANGYVQYTPAGNETPFWSMARLGGDENFLYDQMTLRGYGAGRFVDNNEYAANLEVRTRVYEADLFGTHGVAELAPFVEAGRVAHHMSQSPVSALHPVTGMGFRAIAEPFVVGYVDVGVGGEGAAVFSGINYPF